jgi:hypothetical protein
MSYKYFTIDDLASVIESTKLPLPTIQYVPMNIQHIVYDIWHIKIGDFSIFGGNEFMNKFQKAESQYLKNFK